MAVPAAAAAPAGDRVWRHAVSLMGEPKMPEGFERFPYVNPEAPKGGQVRLSELGSFDTFNPLLPQGEVASGLGLVFEPLMRASDDEVSTMYGGLAEALSFPDDFSSVTFRLNPRARWHDGEPVTAEDVVWSFEQAIALNPSQANYYSHVESVAVTGPGEVTFTFDEVGNRELPYIVGQVLVLPRHWWAATGPNGQPRAIGASTLEPPLGSGPYRIGAFQAGRSVAFERVPDYWGADEPANIGQNNFGTIRYEYFRDTTVMFEAFKGDQFDWWTENIARRWAREYNFAAVTEGRVVQELFENPYRSLGVMVGFVPNLRLEKFQDPLVREALSYAFNFEELNQILFFGQYERINSYFYGTELASSGLPEGEELAILQSVRDGVPPEVFTESYTNPVGGDASQQRTLLRQGLALLTEAGYRLDGNRLVDASGRQLAFEVLLNGPTIEPVALHWQTNLRAMGIEMTIRTVDSAQYVQRVRSRDYEVIYGSWGQSLSPGNEQYDYWGSVSANAPDTRNYGGIADPAIDELIRQVVFADDRETLVAATRALDRVLLHHHFVLPTYTLRSARVARWDRFSHPEILPEYDIGFPATWWWDEAKVARTGAPR
ncbi:extracellular solute-binding protein [Devosia enhydra]|nr:extracellular solute-binding protein [Devosia enhydra]